MEEEARVPGLAASLGVLAGVGLQENQLPARCVHRQGAAEAVVLVSSGSHLYLRGGRRGLEVQGAQEGSVGASNAGGPFLQEAFSSHSSSENHQAQQTASRQEERRWREWW